MSVSKGRKKMNDPLSDDNDNIPRKIDNIHSISSVSPVEFSIIFFFCFIWPSHYRRYPTLINDELNKLNE